MFIRTFNEVAGNSKILFISNYSKHSQGGGIKTFVENIFEELNGKEYELFLAARYGKSTGSNEKIIKGNTFVFIILTFLNCLKIKPAIIHSHANWYCVVPALLYKTVRKVKVVHTIHSIPEKKYSFQSRLVFNWLLQRCDHVQFVSIFLKRYFRDVEGIHCKRSSIVYPGSDHALKSGSTGENEDFFAKFSIPKDGFIIVGQGLTGHLLKYRGAVVLLEAFSRLLNEFPNLVLILTKDGKYINSLKDKARELGIDRSVCFTYNLDNPIVANEIADIYAHITFGEGGVSLAVLEAMAASNPIVATRSGGLPELLTDGETALLVDADPASVYAAIKKLIVNESLRESIGSRAKRFATSQFTWNITAAEFIKVYRSLQERKTLTLR